MCSTGELRRIAERAVEEYNRHRSPESHAELISVTSDRITVKFTGSFPETCGVRDWVEDYAYILEDLGLEASLEEFIEPEDDDNYRIGVFRVKGWRKVGES
jgi:hypothetical protein